MSALISSQGVPVPLSHAGRFSQFARLRDPARPDAATQEDLRTLTVPVRNASLSYDETDDALPGDRFGEAVAADLLPTVHRFAREAWAEIR